MAEQVHLVEAIRTTPVRVVVMYGLGGSNVPEATYRTAGALREQLDHLLGNCSPLFLLFLLLLLDFATTSPTKAGC